VALIFASAAILQACVDALIIGGVATGVVLAADRRQAEVMYTDQRIEFAAGSRIGEALKDQGHVSVTSYNYTVLVTGEVPTAQAKAEVEKIVSEIPQVKTVVNELQIAGASSAASRSNDAYITSKVKGNFLGNGKVRPTDVKIVTEAGVVYLLGLVTREEADAATEVARGTGGVQKVVRVFEYVTRPRRNRNGSGTPCLGFAFGGCEHPLDLADELAVAGCYSTAEGQHLLAGPVDQVLVEIPPGALAGLRGKRRVQGVGVVRRHAGFREHRKAYAVVDLAEFGDVAIAPGSWPPKSLAGKPSTTRPLSR